VKRIIRIGVVAATLTLAARASEAQIVNGVWQSTPQPAGTAAVARDPQPFVVVSPTPTVFSRSVFPRQAVLFTTIPAILLSDGTIVANFGFGFEPVYRACGGAVVVGEPRVIAGNGVVLSPGTPTYTQPVPNQATASQQLLSSAQSVSAAGLSTAARSACFSRDAAGGLVIFR
jgi:hypothetical protein